MISGPPGVILEALHYRSREPVRISLEGRRIRSISKLRRVKRDLPLIAPGLVDLHINGYRGHDFNAPATGAANFELAVKELHAVGVTTLLPTLVTCAARDLEELIIGVRSACRASRWVRNAVAGLHLEGPFISPEDGARGVHDLRFVRAPEAAALDRWQRVAQGSIRMITLSPEWKGAEDFIRHCRARRVAVSIGHTAALPERIAAAVQAGARFSTHLGNGSHLLLPRHHNYFFEQLADDRLQAMLIADGFHLPPALLKVILRVKGRSALLVSDAVALAGCAPGTYASPVGGRVVLTPEGRLHPEENPNLLAGSAQPLIAGVENLVSMGFLTLPEAWERASLLPAAALGLPCRKGLTTGAPADVVLFRMRKGKAEISSVYKGGQCVYAQSGG